MSRLALGTVQFGLNYGVANRSGQVSRSTAKAMLALALDGGVNMLDTAVAYGESEACLGEVGTDGFKVVSKLPAVPEVCPDVDAWVQAQITMSLARLGVKGLYGLLLHRPDQLLAANGMALYMALLRLKEAGTVQKIGISIYAPDQLAGLASRFHFDIVQAPLNLVDRRLHASGWLQKLKDADVEVHTRSAFLQGLLLMPRAGIPEQFARWTVLWRNWHEWLEAHGADAVKACLAYPLSLPEVDRVVVGADSLSQLAQIIDAARAPCPDSLPDLRCGDQELINPALWPSP